MRAAQLVSTATGCRLYIVGTDAQDQDTIHVIEVWDNELDHDNSLNLPGVRELITQARPLMNGRPEGFRLEVLGGAGLDLDK